MKVRVIILVLMIILVIMIIIIAFSMYVELMKLQDKIFFSNCQPPYRALYSSQARRVAGHSCWVASCCWLWWLCWPTHCCLSPQPTAMLWPRMRPEDSKVTSIHACVLIEELQKLKKFHIEVTLNTEVMESFTLKLPLIQSK